jgi:hypothetical protein
MRLCMRTLEERIVIRAIATTLLFGLGGTFLHPVRVTYWAPGPGEYDFVIKGHLGVDHERVCGVVTKDGDLTGANANDPATKDAGLWDVVTMKSAGARTGISRSKLPLDAAKLAAEEDCR